MTVVLPADNNPVYVLYIQLSAIEKSTHIAEEEKKELMAHINVSKKLGISTV